MSDTFPTPATLAELQAMLSTGVRVRLTLAPDLARQINAHNSHRRVRYRATTTAQARVEYFVRASKSGSWDPDRLVPPLPDTIGVTPDPDRLVPTEVILLTLGLQILNGWHRLQAVDLADLPIIVDMQRG